MPCKRYLRRHHRNNCSDLIASHCIIGCIISGHTVCQSNILYCTAPPVLQVNKNKQTKNKQQTNKKQTTNKQFCFIFIRKKIMSKNSLRTRLTLPNKLKLTID